LEDVSAVGDDLLVQGDVLGVVGLVDDDLLDLVELVHAIQPAVSLPAAPASRRKQVLAAHMLGQVLLVEDLAAEEAGERDLAGADEHACCPA
jgi:hypothetical protein